MNSATSEELAWFALLASGVAGTEQVSRSAFMVGLRGSDARKAPALSGRGDVPAFSTRSAEMSDSFDIERTLADKREASAASPARATWQRVMSAAKQVWQSLRARLAAQRYDSLHGLDELTLKDIGLDRSEISSVEAERKECAPTRLRLVDCEAA